MKFNDLRETRKKKAVSRVLSRPKHRAAMIIHLGQPLPTASSDRTRRLQASNLSPTSTHPALANRRRECLPIWSCTGWGLPNPGVTTGIGALLPHRFTLAKEPRTLTSHTVSPWRFVFCGTFLRVTPTGCYPAPCSAEPGLSSPHLTTGGDHLAFFFLEKGVARRPAIIGIRPSNVLAPAGLNDWHPVIEHGTCNPTAVAGPCATPCPARAVQRRRVVGLRVRTKAQACHGLGWRMSRAAAPQ